MGKKKRQDEEEILVSRPTDERLQRRKGGYVKNEIVDAVRAEMSNEEYHSQHAGGTVSRSELQTFAENPADYRDEILLRTRRRKISDDMRLGQCLHIFLLEGDDEAALCPGIGEPGCPLSANGSRAGKKWEEWLAENGPYYLLPKEYDVVRKMADKVRNNDAVKEFLETGGRFNTRHESTILAKHEPTGLRTRCRYDIESVWLFDIKKAGNVTPQKFASHCADFGYHCQAAFYQDHNQALLGESTTRPFLLIAVKDDGDHRVAVYQMSDEFIQIGRILNAHRLDLFAMYQSAWETMQRAAKSVGKTCAAEEIWTPATEGTVRVLNPPFKAITQMDWEEDPGEVHEELEKRVRKYLQKLGV